MRNKSALLILLFHLISFNGVLLAQESGDHPTVGLVLSGGGAKGLAHIGVLKVLEEVGIVPDYITGTSMGSIIGGLYAIGYSADELENMALTTNWDAILTNQTALSNLAIEEKDHYGRYQLSLPMSRWKLGLPTGMIEGQELGKLLSHLTWQVHSVNDFDSLPRPFRCIGADIENGSEVVLSSGFLPAAMRASMAIPTIFTPVEIDGRLLVDGGIVQNFPVEEVRAMGADIVIGVLVSDSLAQAEDLNSLVAILNQWMFITSVNNMNTQIKQVDYLVRPTMYPYGTGSFNNADSILIRGERAARAQYDVFRALADSLRQLRTFEPIPRQPADTSARYRNLIVEDNQSIPDDLILGKLRINPGDSLNITNLEDRMDALYGTQYFDKISYAILPVDSNEVDVVINVKESAPGRASFNLHFDSENSVGLLTNLTFRNVGLPNTKLTMEADLSDVFYFNAQYFAYTGKMQNLGLSLGAKYYTDELTGFDFEGQAELTLKNRLWHYYLNFQTTRRRNSGFGLRLFSDHNVLKPAIADSLFRRLEKLTYRNFGIKPYFVLDNINKRSLPSRGRRVTASFSYLFSMHGEAFIEGIDPVEQDFSDNLWSFDLGYEQHFSLGRKVVLSTAHYLRFTNQDSSTLNASDFHFVGGFKPNFEHTNPYWGAGKYEYQLTSYYLGAVTVRYEPWRNLFLSVGINYLETRYPMEWISKDLFQNIPAGNMARRAGGVIRGTYNTLVGPLSFSLAKDFSRSKLYPFLSLGYNFRNFREP